MSGSRSRFLTPDAVIGIEPGMLASVLNVDLACGQPAWQPFCSHRLRPDVTTNHECSPEPKLNKVNHFPFTCTGAALGKGFWGNERQGWLPQCHAPTRKDTLIHLHSYSVK